MLTDAALQLPEGLQLMLQGTADSKEEGISALARGSMWAGASHWRYTTPANSQAESKPANTKRCVFSPLFWCFAESFLHVCCNRASDAACFVYARVGNIANCVAVRPQWLRLVSLCQSSAFPATMRTCATYDTLYTRYHTAIVLQ